MISINAIDQQHETNRESARYLLMIRSEHDRQPESVASNCHRLLDNVLQTFPNRPVSPDYSMSCGPSRRGCETSATTEDSGKNNVHKGFSPALSTYFQALSQEMDIFKGSSVNIVVDNARIPIPLCSTMETKEDVHTPTLSYHGENKTDNEEELENTWQFHERMSRSLSDMPTVAFPPPFLMEDQHSSASSRWESFNSSGASFDQSLVIPHRTRDQVEDSSTEVERGCLKRAHSLDSTEKLLQELPLHTGSSHSHGSNSSSISGGSQSCRRVKEDISVHNEDHSLDDNSFGCQAMDGDDWPSLRSTGPIVMHYDPLPRQALRRISEGTLDSVVVPRREVGLPWKLQDKNVEEIPQEEKDPETLAAAEEQKVPFETPPLPPRAIVRHRWVSPFSSELNAKMNRLADMTVGPSCGWAECELKLLPSHNYSPQSLAGFPLPPSLVCSNELSITDDMGEIFESTGRILGIKTKHSRKKDF